MSDQPFQIPGLGQGKSDDILPTNSFTPDLLVAAAAAGDEDVLASVGVNVTATSDATASAPATIEPNNESNTQPVQIHDVMDTETDGAPTTKDDITMANQETTQEASKEDEAATENESTTVIGDRGSSVDVTSTLEAALDSMMPRPTEDDAAPQNEGQAANEEAEHQEWEVDSSPYESSDLSSSDSSSDEDEGDYPILGIQETADLLMAAEDGDDDDDGPGKSGKGGAPMRTKNEIAEDVIPKPDVTITPEMKIELIGQVQFVVENTIVIKSKTPGENQVLNSGSVLCKEDRTVIGALADIIGNVRSPLYTVGFAKEEEIKELGLEVGTPIFYSVKHADYILTQVLKAEKWTDASNIHDEELGPDEMEFSDDEKEAEHKKAMKMKKRGAKAGRGGRDHNNQHPHNRSAEAGHGNLNYDEDEDGPYKPLSRPSTFGQGLPSSLPARPETGFSPPRGSHIHRGSQRGRGDFQRGGRGGRGGSRGGRGGREFGHRGGRGGSTGYEATQGHQQTFQMPQGPQAPLAQAQNPHLPPPPFGGNVPVPAPPVGHWPGMQGHFPPPPPLSHQAPPPPNFNFNYQAWNQAQRQQPQYQYPQQPAAQHGVPPPPQPVGYPQGNWAGPPPPVAGAYVNPAFLQGAPQGQQGQQQGQPAPQQQYWTQQQGAYGQGPN